MLREKKKYVEFFDKKRKVFIYTKVLKTLNKISQNGSGKEAGGILLGYSYNHYDEVVKITTPSKFDTCGINFYIRSKSYAQIHINNFWNKSKGRIIYLGEWHTHNEINPSPSLEDMQMINKVCKETIMEINHLYLIIGGIKNTLWVGRQNDKGLVFLKSS